MFARPARYARSILLCSLLLTAASPAHADEPRLDALTAEIVDRTNQVRAEAGCGPLAPAPGLEQSAQAHAADMAEQNYFAHSDAVSPARALPHAEVLPRAEVLGENIAAGNAAAAETFHQWITSPGHRANILDCRFTGIGVGHAYDPSSTYGHYWVQEFAGTT
ncbi:CAP domain-containing protein [Saccharopolyspora sp. NPDC047091]|uniref:CAP domain-containing protein n=1 Tax=Saccharopolyspora sp. NPDC047091 TaxID=3155924 RepID=UPI0033D69496